MSHFSPEELVAYLRHTNLPTVLVEGSNDANLYRRIEKALLDKGGNVLPCGGRNMLLQIFRRRHEFSHVPLAFLADKDLWLYEGVPEEYQAIVWTHGMTIENDVYVGSQVEQLLDPEEAKGFTELLNLVCSWFAFEIEQTRSGNTSCYGESVHRVLDENCKRLNSDYLASRGYREPNRALFEKIRSQYKSHLRGKTLFQCLLVFLSHSKRPAKHSLRALIESCVCFDRNPDMLTPLIESLRDKLEPQPSLPLSEKL